MRSRPEFGASRVKGWPDDMRFVLEGQSPKSNKPDKKTSIPRTIHKQSRALYISQMLDLAFQL